MSGIMTAYITTSSTTVGREYLFLSLSFFFFFFLVFYYFTSVNLQYSVYTQQKLSVDLTVK